MLKEKTISQNLFKEQLCNFLMFLFSIIVVYIGNIIFHFIDQDNIHVLLIGMFIFYSIDLLFDLFVYFVLKKKTTIKISQDKLNINRYSFFQQKYDEIFFQNIVFQTVKKNGFSCYETLVIETASEKYYISRHKYNSQDFEELKTFIEGYKK